MSAWSSIRLNLAGSDVWFWASQADLSMGSMFHGIQLSSRPTPVRYHFLARNHALVDGNKRTAWAAAWTFLTINGMELCPGFDIDAAELLVLDVATGSEDSIEAIAEALGGFAVRLPDPPPSGWAEDESQ